MNNGNRAAFPSLAALRTAHNALLQAHRDQPDLQSLLPEIESFLQRGQATGALLDVEQERWTAQSLLDYWTATVLSATAANAPSLQDAMLADFDPRLAPELPDDLCPYVGLDAFREEKSSYFFGRLRLATLLIEKINAARLVAVVGPSGSGKSSLVLAGLIPALKQGAVAANGDAPSSTEWRYAPRIVPGSEPLENLARILQSAGGRSNTAGAPEQHQSLRQQAAALKSDHDQLTTVVNTTGDAPTVLVVDQFEELFTLCTDEATRQAFANNLLRLTQAPGPRHTVILTMRTDFESFIMRLPGFQPFFEQALVRVTPLNAAELRDAIEKPAEAVGLKFEEGIVEALLHDILGEPAALPLLQFTLYKLWQHRERNRITWEAYRKLGGGRLALARSADELYDSLIPEEQVTARRILLRLVRPGEGLEVTSNRIRRDALYQSGEARDRVDRVLQRLLDAQLLRVTEGDTSADVQVEVAHEALVRNWPRLVAWLDEERERLRERLRLTEAAEQWEQVGRDSGALLRGALLESVRRYTDLNDLENEFVRASQLASLEAQRAEEAARQREIDQARQLAEEQRQRADTEAQWAAYQAQIAARLRRRAVLLTILSVLAVLLALAAGISGWIARQTATAATEARMTADAERIAAETVSALAVEARKTAISERDEGLAAKIALADNVERLLTVQADAGATITAQAVQLLATPTPQNTPTRSGLVYPRATPTPTTTAATDLSAVAPSQPESLAVQAAVEQVQSVRDAQATAAALSTPIARMSQTIPGSTASVADTSLVFEVVAFDPQVGPTNGSGIDFVEMKILDNQGNAVYTKNESNPGYCAFGGGEPDCATWTFADNKFIWPDGSPMQSGTYTLHAGVYATNGAKTILEQPIELVLPAATN